MRTVIDYIPYELQEVKDYQQISFAVEKYIEKINNNLSQMNNNRNILNADEDTIIEYERLLNIIPQTTATIDERRYAVWIKLTTKTPYTEQWLRHWLSVLLGQDNYDIRFNYSNYSFVLKITLDNEKNFNTVVNMLDQVIPAHINYTVTYLYNTWEQAKYYTWESIKNYNWDYVLKSENF